MRIWSISNPIWFKFILRTLTSMFFPRPTTVDWVGANQKVPFLPLLINLSMITSEGKNTPLASASKNQRNFENDPVVCRLQTVLVWRLLFMRDIWKIILSCPLNFFLFLFYHLSKSADLPKLISYPFDTTIQTHAYTYLNAIIPTHTAA